MTQIKQHTANFLIAAVVLTALANIVTHASAQEPGPVATGSPVTFLYDHATLSVANIDNEIAWYERVMGFKVMERQKKNDNFEVAELTMPGNRIDMSWRKGSVRHRILDTQMDQGWAHVVFASPDLEADYNQLVALKADVKANRNKDATIGRLILHDPEGNEIEIQKPDIPRPAIDNPLRITPEHVTLSVADLDKELDWYERVLGFKVKQRINIGDTAIVCHMIIADNQIDISWNRGSARHAMLKGDLEQGWLHMVFNTPNVDAIYSQLVAQHADVRADKDKDSKITMVSVTDPEGNELLFQPSN